MSAFKKMRYNGVVKRFTDRLAAAGKPFKVVITAAMRKLLIILNTIVKTNTPWKEPLCAVQSD